MDFAETLNKIMQEKGITAYQLAKKIGASQQALSDWKRGKYLPNLDKIKLLAEALGVELAKLLGENEQKNKPVSKTDELRNQIMRNAEKLSPEALRRLLDQAELLLAVQKNKPKK